MQLECVKAKARELKEASEATPSVLETSDSDGRAEAVVAILKECLGPIKNTPDGRLLRIVMTSIPDGSAIGARAPRCGRS